MADNAPLTKQDLLDAIKGLATKKDIDDLSDRVNGLEAKIDKVKANTEQTLHLLDVDLQAVEKTRIIRAEFDELHRKAHAN